MSTAARPIPLPEADVARLESLYTLHERDEVLQFLEDHRTLLPHLFALPETIQRYFPGAPLSLKFFPDPEEPGLDHLDVGIGTDLDFDAAMKEIDRLEDEWLVNADPDVLILLLFEVAHA